MIWLTTEQVIELGVPERTLRDWARKEKLTTREREKAKNGKARREILLSSLPPEWQARYFKSQISNLKSQNEDSAGAGGEGGHVGNSADVGSKEAGPPPPASPSPAAKAQSQISDLKSQIGNPLVGLAEEELQKINDYAAALRQAQGKSAKTRTWIARGQKISIATLDRDVQRFKVEGVQGLIRKKRNDDGGSRIADRKVLARIQAEYLKPYRPPVSEIHRLIKKDYEMSGLRPPSYSFVWRIAKGLAPDLVARFRIGERHYDDKFVYYTQRKKPPLPRQWCDADHHPCDHYVIFPDGSIGRPWLTAIQDICTNEVLGFRLTKYKPVGSGSYPGANAIALTLRHAVLKKPDPLWPSYGVFENFYADLGRDFRSHHVRAICADLAINIRHTRGYHGKSKPIERWFGVMELPLGRLPGYCGNNPQNNPERQHIGPPRKPEEMRKELLTIGQYEAAVYDWVVKEFHHRESRALRGLSPIAALEAHVKNGWIPRAIGSERALDLLLMHRQKKPVQRRGIAIFGTKYEQRFFGADELLELIGQEVEIFWDPAEIGEVLVYKDNRFVCKAVNRELLEFGDSEENVKRERAIRREQDRRSQERYEEVLKQAQYPNPLARARAEERYEQVLDEERRQIAAGAEPSRSASIVLPKYQQAAKKLKAVRTADRRPPTASRLPSTVAPTEPWQTEEELPGAEEIFKRDVNPWIEEEG